MKPEFWRKAWREGRTRFHSEHLHPDLRANAPWFLGDTPQRVFVPLSGKSVDLAWMASQGHEVVGVELVEKAVREQFREAGLEPSVEQKSDHRVFRAGSLTIWCADYFELPDEAGGFDRVWDRAALVALPPDMRPRYTARMLELSPSAQILLCTFEYDTTMLSGPPFVVYRDEVEAHFAHHNVEVVDRRDDITRVPPRLAERGLTWWITTIYRITPR